MDFQWEFSLGRRSVNALSQGLIPTHTTWYSESSSSQADFHSPNEEISMYPGGQREKKPLLRLLSGSRILDHSARHDTSRDLLGSKLWHASKAHLLKGVRRTEEAKSG